MPQFDLNRSAGKQQMFDSNFERFIQELSKHSSLKKAALVLSVIQFGKLLSFRGVASWIKLLAAGFVFTTISNYVLHMLASRYLYNRVEMQSESVNEKEKFKEEKLDSQ